MNMTKIEARNGKKYVLLSEQLYKALKNYNENVDQFEKPVLKKVKTLNQDISDLLYDESINDETKAQKMGQLSKEFLEMREKAITKEEEDIDEFEKDAFKSAIDNIPSAIVEDPHPPQQETRGKTTPPIDLSHIPTEKRREKAEDILNVLKRQDAKIFSWSPENQELIIRGHPIKDSNIFTFLDYITKNSPNLSSAAAPLGVGRALEVMGATKMLNPKMIPNKYLRELVVRGEKSQIGEGVEKKRIKWSKY